MLFYKLENGRVLNVAEIVDYNDTELRTSNGFLHSLSEVDRLGIENVLNQKMILYPRSEPLEVSVTSDDNVTVYEAKNTEAEKALALVNYFREIAKEGGPNAKRAKEILNQVNL